MCIIIGHVYIPSITLLGIDSCVCVCVCVFLEKSQMEFSTTFFSISLVVGYFPTPYFSSNLSSKLIAVSLVKGESKTGTF